MKKKIRIMVVDDHSMMRLALSEAISHESDLTLVGEAANAEQTLKVYREQKPDVVTMDFQLPGTSGPELTEQIRKEFPTARIIMLSIFEGEEDIWKAMKAGAMGYIPKSIETADMLEAIRQVGTGNTFFPPAIAKRLDARYARETLTPRELQVLGQIVSGRSNKEIMSDLNLSEGTVKLHVSNILTKLQVLDRTQAAIQAVRRGIIHLDG